MKRRVFGLVLILVLAFSLSSCFLFESTVVPTKKYRVSFYSDNELVSEKEYKEGQKITAPFVEKEGYNLIGWYKDFADNTSEWDFNEDEVSGHTRLNALWDLKIKHITIENIRLVDDYLYFETLDGAIVSIDPFVEETTDDYIDLSLYQEELKEETELTFTPIKQGYTSVEVKIKLKYNESEVIESYLIDFEPFDLSTFKELNRSTFKSSLIDYDDHHLFVNEGRLTAANQGPKNGSVALVLREDGYLELKEAYEAFEKLSFNFSSFNNAVSSSSVSVYVSSDQEEWLLVDTFEVTNYEPNTEGLPIFDHVEILKTDVEEVINTNNPLYFKIDANRVNTHIVIDDVKVYEMSEPYYSLTHLSSGSFEVMDYYKSAEGLIGEELINELRIIISTNLNPIQYRDIKEILEFSDVHPTLEGRVLGIYDRADYRANWGSRSEWHREHVWPNSRLGMDRVKENEVNQGSDPHNLRAIQPSVNSSRSNRYYNNKTDESNVLGHTLITGQYYPGDEDKGDVARILLYMIIRYEELGLTDHLSYLERPAYTVEAAFMGLLTPLLAWHLEDQVDNFELNRNEVIFEYQNNRNPFIDHPEFFELVYTYLLEVDSGREVAVYYHSDVIYVDNYFKRLFENIV